MKLYHVTFDINESETKIFRPRVPASAGVGEDKKIPRICLAPSIEKCIQAKACVSPSTLPVLPSFKSKTRQDFKYSILFIILLPTKKQTKTTSDPKDLCSRNET